MNDRLKFRVYFKGSEYAEAGYQDLTRDDVIFSLRADGQIIRTVVYECQQEGHEGSPCNMPFTPMNELYDIQFCTGMKDKNGKLIYEGDFLKDDENLLYEVIFKLQEYATSFSLKRREIPDYYPHITTWCGLGYRNCNKYEVVGNIYENK